MLVIEFFRWWYGRGLAQLFKGILGRLRAIVLAFSLPILVRTLFAPWRRIISYSSGSLGDRFRAMLDNLISRVVGTMVRLVVMLTAVIGLMVVAVGGAVALVVWPLLPVIAVGLVVRGLLS